MLSTILCIIAFFLFIRFTFAVTWTLLRFFFTLVGYGMIFVLIVAVFGFVIMAPILFVAGVIWAAVKCFGAIF